MAKIPESLHEHTTATAIIRWHGKQSQDPRPHLGFSEVGKECKRAIWYSFRWASERKFDGRMLRLFNRGQREEPQFLAELRGIGVEIYDLDPETNQQFRFVDYKGHFAGSCDAIGKGFPEAPKSWAVAEFKTHNAKSFADLLKQGVKGSKPLHYAQMQLYMGKADLDRALYLAANKDNDDVYSEWVHFDAKVFEQLREKAIQVIDSDEPLERISSDPAWYQCKLCDHHAICQGEKVPQKNCRTCVHSTPIDGGDWYCDHHNRNIAFEEQLVGCRDHLFLPPLIHWAEPLDAGDDWIKYKDRANDIIFANVTEDADRSEENMTQDITICLTSNEMVAASRGILLDPMVADIKREFPDSRIKAAIDEEPPF